MFHNIDYRTETRFEPIRVMKIKSQQKKYNDCDVIIGKSMLREEVKKCSETGTILELMKGMNKSSIISNKVLVLDNL